MNATAVIDIINNNEMEEAIAQLRKWATEELYEKSLSGSGAKARYAAMKRYIKQSSNTGNRKLGKVFKEENWNFLIDGCCCVFTTEDTGELPVLEEGESWDTSQWYKPGYEFGRETICLNAIFAEAKARGWKRNVNPEKERWLVKLGEQYFNPAVLERAFTIIDNGEDPWVCGERKPNTPLWFKTEIGQCICLPVNVKTVVNVPSEHIIDEEDVLQKLSVRW